MRSGRARIRGGGLPLAVAACLAAAGCSGVSREAARPGDPRDGGWARVEDVPFVRQTSRQGCGAAALAMVLGHWGVPVTQHEIWDASPPPGGEGLRASALRDFARGRGLQAYLVQGRPSDLHRELSRGRPLLVGVMKRQGRKGYPHYEVVVGIHPDRRRLVVLDPARGARELRLDTFTAEWEAAGRVTLVVFPPAEARPAPVPVSGAAR